MSISITENVIKSFISSPIPQIIAIKGKWGSGKTYIWNKVLKSNRELLGNRQYSYLSLFGISTIQEFKTSLALSAVSSQIVGEKFNFDETEDNFFQWFLSGSRRLLSSIQQIREVPSYKGITIPFEVLVQLKNRNKLICIDDLERINNRLILFEDILGVISNLKEEKNCSIVIIFNEEKLGPEGEIYKRYREKIIDIEIEFSPTPEEAFGLVFDSSLKLSEEIKKNVINLEITNIRLLKKIQKIILELCRVTEDFHEDVHRQIIHTATFFAFCYFEKEEHKPDIEKIELWNEALIQRFIATSKMEPWTEFLLKYGITHLNQLDLEIFKFIKFGYLADSGFFDEASKLNKILRDKDTKDSFFSAWDLFFNSFDDNSEEIINLFSERFESSLPIISINGLDTLVVFLRKFEKNEKANSFIDMFFSFYSKEDLLYLYNTEKRFSPIVDKDLKERFEKLESDQFESINFHQSVDFLLGNNYLPLNYLGPLVEMSVEGYIEFFKQYHGENLRPIIIKLLDLKNINSSSCNEYSLISQKVTQALEIIKSESKINALRVESIFSAFNR